MSQELLNATLEAESQTDETRGFIRQVKRVTRRKYTPEEKIRIVLEGFRHEVPNVSHILRIEEGGVEKLCLADCASLEPATP